jgi:enoyl-CoA hydratase
LNHPDHLNTIVPPMPDEIEAAVGLAERDPEIKVIVLRGAGRAFSGGYDFGDGLLNNGTRNGTLTIDIDNRTLRAEP